MANSKGEIRQLVEKRLGLNPDSNSDLIELYIDEIEQRILNYVNVLVVPDGLTYTWATMVAGALSLEQPAILFPPSDDDAEYEMTVGDTTVKPIKPATPPSKPTLAIVDKVMLDYRGELNAYRKLRW
jgi:hypothetical protein